MHTHTRTQAFFWAKEWGKGKESRGGILSSILDGTCKMVKDLDGRVPVNAGISDRLTVGHGGEISGGGNVLTTLNEVTFDHDTSEGLASGARGGHLTGNFLGNAGLLAKDLFTVPMTAIDHDGGGEIGLFKGLDDGKDMVLGVVGPGGTATEDDMTGIVTLGGDDGGETVLGDGEEGMTGTGSADGIDGSTDAPIGTILEANGAGETGGKLPVDLALGGPGANGAPGNEISGVLGGDGIEELTADGDTELIDIEEKLTGLPKSPINLEGAIKVRIIDETLPADGGPGLFKIDAHNNEKILGDGFAVLGEFTGIVKGGYLVVDGAGADDDEQSIILAVDDLLGHVTALKDGNGGETREGQILHEDLGGDKGPDTGDTLVIGLVQGLLVLQEL